MKKRTISFRCPKEIFEEMDQLCSNQQVDRSTFIIRALQNLLSSLAEQGVIPTGSSSAATPDKNEQ